jgi:hypothetical protein
MGFCVRKLADAGPEAPEDGLTPNQGQPEQNGRDSGEEVTAMPGGDRTGPAGAGPMTGRAAGYCAGYGVPGYVNPAVGAFGAGPLPGAYTPAPYAPAVAPYGYATAYAPAWFGRGFGRGRGRGRGFGRGGGRGRRWFGW